MSDAAAPHGGSRWAFVPVGLTATLVAAMWLRFGGQWAENDTVVLTRAARGVLDQGTITPAGVTYDHGFAYPTLLATLAEVTGVSVRILQTTILPWLTVATALVACVAFRAVTGNAQAGAMGASFLLLQPDFLFVNQRGSHEKMTWTLVLALLFALAASLRARRLGEVGPLVVVFYLCGFAVICTNAFFGSSLTTVILFAAVGSAVVARRFLRFADRPALTPRRFLRFADRPALTPRRFLRFADRPPLVRRLFYVFLTLGILTQIVIGYLYTPAQANLGSAAQIFDRIASLYLHVDTNVAETVSETTEVPSSVAVRDQSRTVSSPYTTVSTGWRDTRVFFALTSFTWLLIVGGLFAWLVFAVIFVRRRVSRDELPTFLVWLFAAGAALQIVLSVAVDFSGALGGNLQLRLFPVFTVFAVPLIVAALLLYRRPRRSKLLSWATIVAGVLGSSAMAAISPLITVIAAPSILIGLYIHFNWQHSVAARRLAFAIGVAAFVGFAGAAILKATNDPVVSNKWAFYTDAEARGVRWVDETLLDRFVWGEYDERLDTASVMLSPDSPYDAPVAYWTTRPQPSYVRYLLLSDTIVERAARLGAILPYVGDDDRIYDNGRVQVFHRVPESPYQP
jgi:hypothetical protein